MTSLEPGFTQDPDKQTAIEIGDAILEQTSPTPSGSIYSWHDIRVGRSVTEWAQNVLRDAQAAEISGTTSLLRLVWTRIEPTLQRDVHELTVTTTISQFVAELDLRYGQWSEMARRTGRRPAQGQT